MTIENQSGAELSGADLETVVGGADQPRYQVTLEEYERILAKKIADAKKAKS